jgi:hypothetical protein
MADTKDDATATATAVRNALMLGWQVAELYHWPDLVSNDEAKVESRLPGRSDFSSLVQAQWLSEQIEGRVKEVLDPVGDPVDHALDAVKAFWENPWG